jgi:uncharacterized protein (TIGR02453 family)
MAAKKSPPPELAPFAGFAKQGIPFFRGLSIAQSREWFHAHKEDYEKLWKEPMQSLLHELREPLAKLHKRKLSQPKIFRINRDVRFSNDKSPYKTVCSGVISFEELVPMHGAALYLQLGLEEEAGAGFYEWAPDQLIAFRKRVMLDKPGAALAKLLESAAAQGQSQMSMSALKRAPAGFPKDHPRVEILKHKGLAMSFAQVPKSARHAASLKDWLLAQAEIAAPVIRWAFENKIN